MPTLRLTALATAREQSSSTHPIQLAGAALDQTLVAAGELAREAAVLVFAGCVFEGPRREQPGTAALSPLLDNEFGASLSYELLLQRGLASTQPHCVLFAEHAPFVSALRVARAFMLGEGLHNVLVVAVDAAGWLRHPACPTCGASTRVKAGAASGLLTTMAGSDMFGVGLRRLASEPRGLAEFRDSLGPGRELCVIDGEASPETTLSTPEACVAFHPLYGSVADRVQALLVWASATSAQTASLAAICEGDGRSVEVALLEHPGPCARPASERSLPPHQKGVP